MITLKRRVFWISALLVSLLLLAGCRLNAEGQPTVQNSAVPTTPIPFTPTEISPPTPTFDAAVQPYLDDVEEILRHSAVVIQDRAVGMPDTCPTLYLMAFPYSEPDRRGGMTLAVTGLSRREDGSIIRGDHQNLWNLKGEGVDPERCKEVIIQDRSEPGFIRISFQVQDPDDRSWRIGVAAGPCPGIDLWLAGYFYLQHPDDFQLWITQYDNESKTDYWLRDGDQLLRYHWEPWQESLLWTLDGVPGTIQDLSWNEESPDANQDGVPDLSITWEISGGLATKTYSPSGTGFILLEDQ